MNNLSSFISIYFVWLLAGFFLIQSCGSKEDQIPEQLQDFCAQIHPSKPNGLTKELEGIKDSMQLKTGVYVLEDGGGSLITRAWLCENAEKSIDIQYFIFSTDNVGLIACDYLVRAADRGIPIRILVDDIMVEAGVHEILTMDSHPNIEIKIYNPGVNLGKNFVSKISKFVTDFKSANQRMHNKTFIVDHKLAITGGRNIADEYFDYDHEYNFRDRDVLLLGKGITQFDDSFEEFWNSSLSVPVSALVTEEETNFNDSSRFDRLHQYACNPENFWPQVREEIQQLPTQFKYILASGKLVWTDSMNFVSDKPGKNDGTYGLHGGGITIDSIAQLIDSAKTSIDIQSPYLITTNEGLRLFKRAVDRGVKIRILTNSLASTDNKEAFSAYQKVRKSLLKVGVRIFEFRPDALERIHMETGSLQKKLNYTPIFGLHAKTMVIDGNITAIGTFNADPRSANLNTECFAIVRSQAIAKQVLNGMEEEYKPENAWETTFDFNPDAQAGNWKRAKTFIRKVLPKSIL